MKVRTTEFRCDLCGRHEKIGVVETKATSADSETSICASCIARATTHLVDHLRDESDRS